MEERIGAGGSRARLQVVLAALLFSTGGAAVKATDLGAWQIASFRCGIAALALILLLPRARRLGDPKIWLVAVTYAATLTLYVLANRLTTAANAIFLQYTAPLYVLLLGPVLLKEKIRRGDLLFMVAVALGMATFFLGLDSPSATAPDPSRGNLVAAGTGLCWGLTLLGLRWVETGGRSGASAAVLAGNLLAFVVTLPLALPMEGTASAGDWWVVVYLGVVQIALAYVFLTRAFGKVRALDVSLLLLLELIFNPVLSWLVHGEVPGLCPAVGCAVILTATVVWTLGPAAMRKKRLATLCLTLGAVSLLAVPMASEEVRGESSESLFGSVSEDLDDRLPAELAELLPGGGEGYHLRIFGGDRWWLPAGIFYVDEMNPSGVWMQGGGEAEVLLVRSHPDDRLRLRLRSATAGNVFRIATAKQSLEVPFTVAGRRQPVPVELALGEPALSLHATSSRPALVVYRLRLESTHGIVPQERNPRSTDARNLGTFFAPRGGG